MKIGFMRSWRLFCVIVVVTAGFISCNKKKDEKRDQPPNGAQTESIRDSVSGHSQHNGSMTISHNDVSFIDQGSLSDSAPYFAFEVQCNDTTIRFFNDTSENGYYVYHRLLRFIDTLNGYYISRSFYEGGDNLLVSQTHGQITTLFGDVFISPQQRFFASIGYDNEAEYSANGVQIFNIVDDSIVLALEDHLPRFGPKFLEWRSDSELIVNIYDVGEIYVGKRYYEFHDGVWRMHNVFRPGFVE